MRLHAPEPDAARHHTPSGLEAGWVGSRMRSHLLAPLSRRAMTKIDPHVGIFWFVRDGARVMMIADKTPLTGAEIYGDFLTHPTSHYDFWESLRRKGPGGLKAAGLPDAPAWYEYEDFPRGRVVYSRVISRFTVYVDARLKAAEIIEEILTTFGLSGKDHVIDGDPHYRSSQSIRQKPGLTE